jgi:hypothetical protein
MKAAQETHSYVHRFRNGIVGKATMGPGVFSVEWEGRPDRTILAEYLRWRHCILTDFAERTGNRILVVDLV